MQENYLLRLSESVKEFVLQVEKAIGLEIQVIEEPRLNIGGPAGGGKLEVIIEAQKIQILAPTNGGCPEFCVNGASVNSSASFPQTGS